MIKGDLEAEKRPNKLEGWTSLQQRIFPNGFAVQ